jgi:hypothetical protein
MRFPAFAIDDVREILLKVIYIDELADTGDFIILSGSGIKPTNSSTIRGKFPLMFLPSVSRD